MPRPPKTLQPERSPADWFGAELRYWREKRELTQRELAQRVWVSMSLIGRIETADRECSPDLARRLDEVLDTGGVLARAQGLVTATRKAESSETDKTASASTGHGAGAGEPSMLEGVERRDFLRTATAGLAVSPLLALSSPFQDTLRPRQVRAVDIAQVREAAAVFSSWDHTYGGQVARAAVAGQLRAAADLLHAPCPHRLRGEAFSAVAQLFMVAGFMAFDAYAHDDARRLFAFAAECAEEAGDWHLRAKVYSHRARQAIWCADPDQGITYAELGLVRSERLSAVEKAMLHTARARAYAKMGLRTEALRAVGEADAAFAAPTAVEPPSWMAYYDAAQHAGDTAHALWDLAVAGVHPPDGALRRLEEAVCGHTDAYARSRAISAIKLASLHLHGRNVEEGLATAARALDDVGRVRSRRAEDDLRELRTLLNRTPEVDGADAVSARITHALEGT